MHMINKAMFVVVLFLGACSSNDSTISAQIACTEQATSWCERAWVSAYPQVEHAKLEGDISDCEMKYVGECTSGGDVQTENQEACLEDIESNAAWNCVPNSCAGSWEYGLGKANPSYWCHTDVRPADQR